MSIKMKYYFFTCCWTPVISILLCGRGELAILGSPIHSHIHIHTHTRRNHRILQWPALWAATSKDTILENGTFTKEVSTACQHSTSERSMLLQSVTMTLHKTIICETNVNLFSVKLKSNLINVDLIDVCSAQRKH